MKIIDLICSRGKTGFYFDDQRAIKNGAKSEKEFYSNEKKCAIMQSVPKKDTYFRR